MDRDRDVIKRAETIQKFFNKINLSKAYDISSPLSVQQAQDDIYQAFGAWRSSLDSYTVTDQQRIQRYREYEQMCYVPELQAGIEIYGDDSSLYNDEDKVIGIRAENNDIEKALEDLWFKSLDMNYALWHIILNTCKYGDAFFEVIPDNYRSPKRIKYIRWLPPQFVFRVELDENLVEFVVRMPRGDDSGQVIDTHTAGAGFKIGGGDIEEVHLKPWQVIHFKIDDKEFDPYGKSVLESGRLAFKQQKLIEDAMLVYRITRAPERRIFGIPVGTLPYREAMQRVQDFQQRYRKTPWIEPGSGEINYRNNPLCIALDTKIDMLDGRSVKLNQLIKEYKEGKENWVYSIDRSDKNKIVPGKILWAGITRKDAELVEVFIDSSKSIRCTPDHKFLLRNGEYKEAQYLLAGDSLIPLYRKTTNKTKGNKSTGYELTYNPQENRYRYTHRLIAEEIFKDLTKKEIIHHKSFDKKNNSPSNLLKCSRSEHRKIHNNRTKDYTKLLREKNGRWRNISFDEIKKWSSENATTFNDIKEHFSCSGKVISSRLKEGKISKKEFSEKMMLNTNKYRLSSYGKKDKIDKKKIIINRIFNYDT